MDKKSSDKDLPTTSSSLPRARSRALRFAFVYAILGALWIVFSDQIVDWLTDEETSILFVQTAKGILYVAVTTALIYWLALRAFKFFEHEIAIRELDEAQRLLDAVLGNLGEGILLIDPQTRTITQCNAAATRIFGYSESEMIGQSTEMLHVNRDTYLQFGATSEPDLDKSGVFRCQCQMKRKDGVILDVDIGFVALRQEFGWQTGVVSIVRDISERVRAYKALDESERQYRLLAENTLDVIWSMDHNFSITYVNPAIVQLSGHMPEEMLGTTIDAYFDDHHLPRLKQVIAQEIEKGPNTTGILIDTEILCKDGSKVPVEVNGKVLFDDEGRFIGLQGSIRDISERLDFEAQLRQSQKMEAIGTLAAGIAHEVNNPIASISGFAQLISGSDEVPNKFRGFAAKINSESVRVGEIVKNLLGYARIEDEHSHSPISMQEVVASTLLLIQAVLRQDNISLEISVENDLPTFNGRRQQVQQVLMNLLTNARDALNAKYPDSNDDKRILISTTMLQKDDTNWLRLTVEDHGSGIPQGLQGRVFDPFYTTKPSGEGTGLGLWLVYSIVENHHGHIWFESEPGAYTRFHVDFPALDARAGGERLH